MLEASANTAKYSVTHNPTGTQGLWKQKGLQLPAYIQNVVHGIMESGTPREKAIPIAIGRIRSWASGAGNVSAEVRAASAKAMAEWEKLKASHNKSKNMSANQTQNLAFTEALHPRVTGAANGGEFTTKDSSSKSSSSKSSKGKSTDKGKRNPRLAGKSDDELSKLWEQMMAMSPPPNPDVLQALAQELYVRGIKSTKPKKTAAKKPAAKKKSTTKKSPAKKKKVAAKAPAKKKPAPAKKPPPKTPPKTTTPPKSTTPPKKTTPPIAKSQPKGG